MSELAFHHILTLAWIGVAGLTFASLLFVTAPYGRHRRPGWGPQVPATLGWVVMELPAVALMLAFFATGRHRGAAGAAVLLVLWQAHYLYRAFVWPFRRRGSGQRMPLAVVAMAFGFNVVNASLNGRWLFELGPWRDAAWLADPRFLVGAALFAAGYAANLHADGVLFKLRRPGESRYAIPEGGLFRLVSCPNYLGEIVEWIGWAVASWSLAGLSFALWTIANLVPRALANHRWYRKTFPDYPSERRALVPFVL